MEQQDYRVFAAHSSLGWSAGERGRFEITFLECKNAVPTTEPQPLKGKQAAEKCAAVLPGKAPSVIKIKPPATQKPVARSWQPWRNTVSALMAVFLVAAFLVALVATTCAAAFGLLDATCFALARGAQPALHTNTTGDLDVISCHPGIRYDSLSDMAIDLLHREAVMRCNAAGLMPLDVHANMLPPSALGFSGFQHSDWHQNVTEGIQCTPKSLPCMHYLQLPVPTISSNPQLGLHDSGMCSSLATVKEAHLLVCPAIFGSPPLKESASLAEQVTRT